MVMVMVTATAYMYFSARAEGRISYGHLGRTNSCYYYYYCYHHYCHHHHHHYDADRPTGIFNDF